MGTQRLVELNSHARKIGEKDIGSEKRKDRLLSRVEEEISLYLTSVYQSWRVCVCSYACTFW